MTHACGDQIHNHSAGGLKAVAQIEDGAVGLGMTTFVSPINSVTSHQKVSCPNPAACLQVFYGCSPLASSHSSSATATPSLLTLLLFLVISLFWHYMCVFYTPPGHASWPPTFPCNHVSCEDSLGYHCDSLKSVNHGLCMQVAAAVFGFRGTVLTKRSNFAADLDVWRNANRDLYFAARAVKHIRLEMAQLQRQYPGVQWGFFCTGKPYNACN